MEPTKEKIYEKNILILGESGVGKSTWINALANYMTYRSMEEALNMNNPVCLIPSQFTIIDGEINSKLVQIGKLDENVDENLEIGKSATKRPKAYVFPYKEGKIRLIDTPGIGDTEGIYEDNANFANILSYISNYEELHGICILLKPDNARLSLTFRYCINELFSNLHKNVAKNIIFCFTNTRGTSFKPGESLSSLRLFLNEMEKNQGVRIALNQNNVFCVDNEAFRFICAAYNSVKFDEKEHLNFAESWRHSASETDRLFAHINSLIPHKTKETVSLNEARRIITTLSQPIAIIAKIIQDNITTMADEKKRLATLSVTEGDIRKKLMTPFIYIKYEILPFPQTICASKNCTECRIGPDGKPHVFYKTVCHDVCLLNGSIENQFPNPELRWCKIFNRTNGNCCKCGCPWYNHMNSRYKQIECWEMVEDPEVKRLLDEGKDKKAAINRAIQSASEKVRQFEAEEKKINEIAARFGSFLKRHALVRYNDAIEPYIKLAIHEARQIAEKTNDFRKVEGLKTYLHIYKEQSKIIDESLNDRREEIKSEDIERYFQELIGLKLIGKNIKQLFDAETIVQKKQMAIQENIYTPPPILCRKAPNANNTILSQKSPKCARKDGKLTSSNPFEESLASVSKSLEENSVQTPLKLMEFADGQTNGSKTPQTMPTKLGQGSDPQSSREKLMEMNESMGNRWEEQKEKKIIAEMKMGELKIDGNPQAKNERNEAFLGRNNEGNGQIVELKGGVENMDIGTNLELNNDKNEIIESKNVQNEEEEIVFIGIAKSSLAKRKIFPSLYGEKSKKHAKINISDAELKNMAPIDNISQNAEVGGNPRGTLTAPITLQSSTAKSKAHAQFVKKLARTNIFPTFLNFCERTPDAKLQNGALCYPWQSLPIDEIHLAYDVIPPNIKSKFSHSSAANAAARALILCGMEHNWDEQFWKFNKQFPQKGVNGAEKLKIASMIGTNSSLAQINPTPWALADYLNNFMKKTDYTHWIVRVFTYRVFHDCAKAISEDIRLDRPVLICYSVGETEARGWHYANVIATKCQALLPLLPQEFVLLAVDRTIQHQSYENLKGLICNGINWKQPPTETADGEKQREAKTFTIIRFIRK